MFAANLGMEFAKTRSRSGWWRTLRGSRIAEQEYRIRVFPSCAVRHVRTGDRRERAAAGEQLERAAAIRLGPTLARAVARDLSSVFCFGALVRLWHNADVARSLRTCLLSARSGRG